MSKSGWRRSAVEPLDLIEPHLERTIRERTDGNTVLGEMIRYHFGYAGSGPQRRGKRLRPQLVVRVALEEGGNVDAALDAAVAIEILHNYSLAHDDIEDGDEMRHGRATIWSKYGVAHGINAGDALCAISVLTLLHARTAIDADRVAKMVRVLHEAHLAMCDGQARDIAFETSHAVDLADYEAMISGKTGALFAAACELGAVAAGADPERARAYADFGAAYGRAFQVRDDELGAWGTPELTGKPSGADISRRKWSFPVVWALAQRPSPQRDIIARAYDAAAPLDRETTRDVLLALERLGARAAVNAAHDRALDHAERIAETYALDRGHSVRDLIALGTRRVA